MSDFERRGADRGRDLAYAPRASASAEPTRQTTPAEQAEAACTVAARAVDDVKGAIAAVHAAEVANEPSRWHAARERVDKAVGVAKKQLARAEATADKAPATAKSQLTAAKETLAEQEQALAQLGVAPTGWTRSEHDAAIHSALAAPVVGAVGPSFTQKESAVRAELAKLSPEQSTALARRLRTGLARLESYQRDSRSADPATRANAERLKPSDPIVEQFALLNVERRERLLQFLADARHRHEAGLARAPGGAPGAAQASSSNTNAESPSAVAARGVAGFGGSLPHASAIQASFGKHDVSPIRAHVGGAAAEASAALGAEAYATSDAVGFAHAPDLHTAAHEAAHAIQQRAGVQLKGGIDGGGGDPHEQHADAVADAVVRGESAESLLDATPRGAEGGAAVQRKPDKHATPTVHDDGPQTLKQPQAKWPVFAENGLPYKIISAKDPVHFWVVRDWVEHGAGYKGDGTHAKSPACAAEILRALGWVPEDRIALAAQYFIFNTSRRVAEGKLATSELYFTGLPTGQPVVSRVANIGVEVVTPVNAPNIPPDTRIEPDDAQRLAVVQAVAAFTGLKPASNAVDELRNDNRPAFHDKPVGGGALLWDIDEEAGNLIFGFDETDTVGRFSRWLHKKADKQPKHAPDAPKLQLHDYYGEPIPGTLQAPDWVEAGQLAWLEIAVAWPTRYPSADEYDAPPMVTPGHRGRLVALLDCEWQIERIGGASTPAPGPKPTSAVAGPAARTAIAPPGATSTPAASAAPGSAPAARGTSAPAGAPTASAGSLSARATVLTSTVAEQSHQFFLPPGQASGTFRITARASMDAYFEPAVFTRTIEVKSTAAAMKQLGAEAFADLGAREVSRTPETFDASGSGDDNHGFRTTGELPASFQPSRVDMPDRRAAARAYERKRLEATRMYLEANHASADVLAAVDRELAASRATEAALASDRSKGWQPFQIRGTYLSREEGVPSGPLTLYGSVHSEATQGLMVHGEQETPGGQTIVVQIRDLSRRFDNEDMTFTGSGDTFESALKAAFLDNAKAYPKGVMAIEAEVIDAHVDGRQATVGIGNGKTIGFELGTDSRWKRVKAEVWKPAINIVANLGAIAIMAFVPSAPMIVAPLLIAYNSTPVIDQLSTESAHGTLTLGKAATSVGEIALNLLPLVGRAEPFTAEWFAIESANWGGQSVVMTASAVQTARALQSQDVEALAAMYEELQKLEASGADPARIEQKRRQVMARARVVSERIQQTLTTQIAQTAMFAAAGTVIHNTVGRARVELIEAYRRSRGAGISGVGEGSASTSASGASAGGEAGASPVAAGPGVGGDADDSTGSNSPSAHAQNRAAKDESTEGGRDQSQNAPDRPDLQRRSGGQATGLDGSAIAAQVPGTTYQPGGDFRVSTAHGTVEVSVRRTTGAARVVYGGDHAVIEIPRGMVGSDFERAMVEGLREVERNLRSKTAPDNTTSSTQATEDDTPSGASKSHEVTGASRPEKADEANAFDKTEKPNQPKRTLDDFLGEAPTPAELSRAKEQAKAEADTSIDAQAKSIRLGHARSERDMLLAINNGEMPRYVARVSPASTRPTFANPNRPFVFATEPADLRGLTGAQAMWQVGWTREWIQGSVGKEIEVTILDTHDLVETPASEHAPPSTAHVEVDRVEWNEIEREALADANFLDAAAAQGVSKADLVELFARAKGATMLESVARVGPEFAPKMQVVIDLMDRLWSANRLYTGIGATMSEGGKTGAREVMVKPNGTGLRLTDTNSRKVSLGVLSQKEVDDLFGKTDKRSQ